MKKFKTWSKHVVNANVIKLNNILIPSVLQQGPWEDLSIDFFRPMSDDEKYWMVLIDDYSRFPIATTISSTAADEVIPVLEEIMSTFGTPNMLKSDNVPPFKSFK